MTQACDNTNTAKLVQGNPLPYSILDNTHPNAAYPEQQLEIRGGGFGSDAAAHPSNPKQFYTLADRGPNSDFEGAAGAGKQFLVPDYTPRIGLFEVQEDGQIMKIKEILLKDPAGNLITGLPNPKAFGGTNEVPYDVAGEPMTVNPALPFDEVTNPIRAERYGLDPEGLAALVDGTFWVSDEYGPHLVHYDAEGVEIERINPFAHDQRNNVMVAGEPILLPAELAKRRVNRGMEGLTITPDQTTLVGMMESALDNPDKSGRQSELTRIVTVNLKTGQISQYLYRRDSANNVNSGIAAISDHEFYVIEHDRKFPLVDTKVAKYVYKIDISAATDIETLADSETINQSADLGLMVAGQTLEQYTAADESDRWTALSQLGIQPVKKTLVVDVLAALAGYAHNKLEGLWLRHDGTLGLLNDDDFAINDSDAGVEHKYLDADKTLIDTTRLYIVTPSE